LPERVRHIALPWIEIQAPSAPALRIHVQSIKKTKDILNISGSQE
jgi:hypothetical protein